MIREIYRLDSLLIAKAPNTEVADILIAKLAPKKGALDTLLRFGAEVGLTQNDFDQAEPFAPCLALTAQFYYHLARSSFAENGCLPWGERNNLFRDLRSY